MKKLFLVLLFAISALTLASCAGKKAPKELEISFNYTKQAGPGSNQYAVWIENEAGAVVKTLFVTAFTTKGRSRAGQPAQRGYTFRPTCVPTWVKAVKAESLSDAQMDAFTGATPASSGVQTFTWDFTDQDGKVVPAGNYKVYLQATYLNEGIVTYCGEFSSKDTGPLALKETFEADEQRNKDMITEVKAELR